MSLTAFDYSPYPWPVKKGLLALLSLPVDATEEEYRAAWEKQVVPLLKGGAQAQLTKAVADVRAENSKLSYEAAFNIASMRNPALFGTKKQSAANDKRRR